MEADTDRVKIKRIAQFLFDNAADIAKVLRKSPHYRSLSISIDMFKGKSKSAIQLSLTLYDEKTTHYYLHDDAIIARKFWQLSKQMDENSGIVALPKPVKVRNRL